MLKNMKRAIYEERYKDAGMKERANANLLIPIATMSNPGILFLIMFMQRGYLYL